MGIRCWWTSTADGDPATPGGAGVGQGGVANDRSGVTPAMTTSRRRFAAICVMAFLAGCATLQQIAALRHVNFALGGVRDGRLAGVRLDRIASYRDLSTVEIGRIALAVARDEVPLSFTVNVRAENPSDNGTTATMVRLAWTLLLDNKETISGVLDTSYALPPGQPVTIPLLMSLDLSEFFGGSAESLIDLAAGLAGVRADPTRVTLRAVPSIDTPLGRMSYPSPITIVNQTVGAAPPP